MESDEWKRYIPVMSVNEDGVEETFPSMKEAQRQTGIDAGTISRATRETYRYAGGIYEYILLQGTERRSNRINERG